MPVPGHGANFWEFLRLATEEVTGVLKHVIFMTLEEVVDEIKDLRIVGQGFLLRLLQLDGALRF